MDRIDDGTLDALMQRIMEQGLTPEQAQRLKAIKDQKG